MSDMTRPEQLKQVQTEAYKLFCKKNKDYGDAFADYGVVGVLVRLGDKIRRAQSISNNGVSLVSDESFRDTLIDLHNYAAMGVMLLDNEPSSNEVEMGKNNCRSNFDDSHAKAIVTTTEVGSMNKSTCNSTCTVTNYKDSKITRLND
tara:strand:- start:1025 stop:1465 length:441 start_codon:yes stop_codon:yes gene_type:complete